MTVTQARTHSGRVVLDTGKVLIGLRAPTTPPRDLGADADAIQTALLRRRGYSVESAAHRLVLLMSIVGIPALVVAILLGWI